MVDCIFCKIINKEIETVLVHEDEKFIAFNDINPIAPLHLLIIPKEHIDSINHLEEKNNELIGELFLTAQKIAKEQKVDQTGYRLVINVGKDAGQTVSHLHLHLLGRKELLM
jgi:histidine triad (HIT) family protein